MLTTLALRQSGATGIPISIYAPSYYRPVFPAVFSGGGTTPGSANPRVSASRDKAEKIGVLTVDDHPAIRQALNEIVSSRSNMEVVGEAESGAEALRLVAKLKPDVAVVDISLRESHGLDLIAELRQNFPDLRIIVFSMYSEDAFAERAIRAGATGYVMKTAPIADVLRAIETAMQGDVYLSRRVASRILTKMMKRRRGDQLFHGTDVLTDREMTVFHLFGEGHDVPHIAQMLDLQHKTVEIYRRRIREKLGIETSAELMKLAHLWKMQNT